MELNSQLYTWEKNPPVPIGFEAGWAPEPVWMLWNILSLLEVKPSPSGPQPVAILTQPSQKWRVAANALNKQLKTWSFSLQTGQKLSTPHHKIAECYWGPQAWTVCSEQFVINRNWTSCLELEICEPLWGWFVDSSCKRISRVWVRYSGSADHEGQGRHWTSRQFTVCLSTETGIKIIT
jgi:hypothetical protein